VELPAEVSTAEAARILGVSKDTVLELKKAGLLEYRNTGSPDSCRPVYAFSLRSVLEVRTTYQRDTPPYHRPEAPHRHQVKGKRKYKHFTLSDD
jgi:excisionase family DNA binding protein